MANFQSRERIVITANIREAINDIFPVGQENFILKISTKVSIVSLIKLTFLVSTCRQITGTSDNLVT